MPKTWFITGATCGLGAQIAKSVIRSGDRVIATGRKREAVIERLGPDSDQLLSVELDVTFGGQARAAVQAALSRFGTIDVLVNNARYGYLGFFEENTTRDTQAQLATNLLGVFNVTCAVLPIMRSVRKGRIFNIASLGGILASGLAPLYCAMKLALEGFSECLSKEVTPFGLFVTIVDPGPLGTDFLSCDALGEKCIGDGDEHRNGQLPGDSAKLAEAIVRLAAEADPPVHFIAGSMGVNATDARLTGMRAELDRWRHLSVSTDGSYAT
jgi:NAD(P)-dependent dehydrogenase (short-subunit alcohol dehydrogenase family)